MGAAGLLLGRADGANANGIAAVIRSTVTGGVPGTAPAPAAADHKDTTVFSPQPSAAAAMLLPGQTPLAAGGRAPMANPIAVQPVSVRPFAVPFSRPVLSVARPAKAVTALAPRNGPNSMRGNSINVAQ